MEVGNGDSGWHSAPLDARGDARQNEESRLDVCTWFYVDRTGK